MFYFILLLAIAFGVILIIVGAKVSKKADKYEFENRTSGGVVEFKNHEESLKHQWRKAGAKLCFSISIIVILISSTMLALSLVN